MLKPGTGNGLYHVGGVVDGLKQRVIVGTRLFYPFVINVYYVDCCGPISSRGATPPWLCTCGWRCRLFLPFLIWGNGDAIGVVDPFPRSGDLVCMTDRGF